MHELALFAGGGGGILGGHLLGWKTVCAVEIESYRIKCLLQRQRDGILSRFPIWDDIKTFDGKPWRDRVDIISGGFPCQDISLAGKGAGITGERSGLWKEMARVVSEVRPHFVFVENSPALLIRGFGTVAGDLVEMGYDLRWCVLGADNAGAPHRRKRIWILAYSMPSGERRDKRKIEIEKNVVVNPNSERLEKQRNSKSNEQKQPCSELPSITWWDIDPADLPDTDKQYDDNTGYDTGEIFEQKQTRIQKDISNSRQNRKMRSTQPRLGRVAHGVAHRVDRLKAIGDGQVPAVAALAFTILSEGLT